MAERRMFAKTIVLSDDFLDMPLSARCLYFTLGMLADDDGFVNSPKSIMRQCGASQDDMRVLLSKKFVLSFDNGIIVIKHWRINNYLRSDRYQETKYVDEKELLELDDKGIYHMLPQDVPTSSVKPEIESTDETDRQRAYRVSSLPYSFSAKIRKAFIGKKCPLCGCEMKPNFEDGILTSNRMPTIQHNIPISKGGEHELGNISVICKQCNITIKDQQTEDLNADEVIEVWEKIVCDSGIPNSGIPSIDKYSIDKNNIYMSNSVSDSTTKKADIDSFFEAAWKAYPKKKGKGQISNAKKKALYESVGLEQMLRCIERYTEYIKGKDEQYTMYGSTFFNSGYVDYLDENCEQQTHNEEDDAMPFR